MIIQLRTVSDLPLFQLSRDIKPDVLLSNVTQVSYCHKLLFIIMIRIPTGLSAAGVGFQIVVCKNLLK
jgi:hypothetical protein